jgi:hypothetical protein
MDEKDSEAPFPREPWKRLLEDSSDGPPETTDARIRAAARRGIVPGGRRWWLPASLAASFVLAVLIAQSQLGSIRSPVLTESDSGTDAAGEDRILKGERADAPRQSGKAPAAPSRRAAPALEDEQVEEPGDAGSEFAADAAGAGPRVGGPEHELKVSSEMPEEAPAASAPAPAASAENATEPFPAADSARESSVAHPELQGVTTSVTSAKQRTPEAWYAEIEELRRLGQVEEANRELERLQKAYPGWLERYLKDRAPR